MQLSVHLQAIMGVYFARNYTRNADSSLNCLLSPASIFSLPPSAGYVLLWTAISNRLFSSALLCQLLSLFFLGPSFPRPLPVSWEISPSGPLCGFRTKNRQKDPLTGVHTHTHTHQHNEWPTQCHINDVNSICLSFVWLNNVFLGNIAGRYFCSSFLWWILYTFQWIKHF